MNLLKIKKIKAIGFSLLIMLLAFGTASATVYYVDGARPDNNGNGTSWASAEKTISAGLAHLSSGDTLKIASGTYAEGMNINFSGSSSNPIRIETDNKSGQPGLVTLTGGVSVPEWGGGNALIYFNRASNVYVDGRQTNGFTLKASGQSWGVFGTDSSDNSSNVSVKYLYIQGTLGGGAAEKHVCSFYGYNNPEIAYSRFNVTAGSTFIIEIASYAGESDPNATQGGSVHHNEIVSGTTYDGYSAISILRHDHCDIYNNYIHHVSGPPAMLRSRQGHDNRFYNNIIWVPSGYTAQCIFEYRGMSTGSGSANRNEFFNNTISVQGSVKDTLLLVSDYSANNKVYNNLLIGNVPSFVAGWNSLGSSNQIYNNVATGNVQWFESSGIQSTFSVSSQNTANAGSSLVAMSGAQPNSYWALTKSMPGSSNGMVSFDYLDNQRSTPDVGAIEYGGSPPAQTTVDIPQHLVATTPQQQP